MMPSSVRDSALRKFHRGPERQPERKSSADGAVKHGVEPVL